MPGSTGVGRTGHLKTVVDELRAVEAGRHVRRRLERTRSSERVAHLISVVIIVERRAAHLVLAKFRRAQNRRVDVLDVDQRHFQFPMYWLTCPMYHVQGKFGPGSQWLMSLPEFSGRSLNASLMSTCPTMPALPA